ncbi:HIT family protein [soil metagenome]
MATIFTRIINGEIPGTFVWTDDCAVAFMSVNPLAAGHVLVLPRAEVDHWLDLDESLSRHLFDVAHIIGRAQADAFGCERVGVIVAGFEVPHTHIHLVPANDMAALSFENAATSVDRDDLAAAAEAIRDRLRAAGHSPAEGPPAD